MKTQDTENTPTRAHISGEILVRLRRLVEIQRELDLRKSLYAEYDLIVMSLAKDGFSSAELDGFVLTLEDHFAQGNTAWTSAPVKRYALEIESKEKVERRTERAKRKIFGGSVSDE